MVVSKSALILLFSLFSLLGVACAGSSKSMGPPPPPPSIQEQVRPNATGSVSPEALFRDAQAVVETRCVVCHGCYDAPCQLVMSAAEGLRRGASTIEVYEASRLMAIEPTRLFIDAKSEASWRDKGFHSVLGKDGRDPTRSLLLRMLDLKREHPLDMNGKPVPESYSLGIDREQTCTTDDDFADYAEEHPSWGMPYALPALSEPEEVALRRWVMAGAPVPEAPALTKPLSDAVARWESFLNGSSNKERLVARYIYEHLFLGHLYFEDVDSKVFFRLVRSRTNSGEVIDEIPSRRPFDDPGGPFFYRLRALDETLLAKTHMPYALSEKKLEWVRALFIEPNYDVSELPSYEEDVASNPFAAFRELPARARYRFMLEEAGYTIMGFIKGPVCRGQVALDVIRDRFWMVFVDPESPLVAAEAAFLADKSQRLELPASDGPTANLTTWLSYSRAQKKWLEAKSRYVAKLVKAPVDVTLSSVWDGEGKNQNAALTVFRHFDSATVVQGLVGEHPQTTWVVDYPILERIHYLLVAGFDVFGNVGHQLNTRMYMDFLRMESEHNFLRLLPPARRKVLVDQWYRKVDKDVKAQVYGRLARFDEGTGITYKTSTPEHELLEMLRTRLNRVNNTHYDVGEDLAPPIRESLKKLAAIEGEAAAQQSEISFIEVRGQQDNVYLTLLRDAAHSNVAELFDEDERRLPKEDRVTLTRGFLGAYPNTLFSVARDELDTFVTLAAAAKDPQAYAALCDRFCVRRTHAEIWPVHDRMTQAFAKQAGVAFGRFDLNRLDNR